MRKAINFLTINKYVFVLGFIGLSILVLFFVLSMAYFLNIEMADRKAEDNIPLYFLKAIIIAPFLETLIFQFAPIEFLKRFMNKDVPIIIISSLFFGFAHFFNDFLIKDVVITFFLGLVFAYSYVLAKKRDDINAFFAVSFIHLGYNMFVFFLRMI